MPEAWKATTASTLKNPLPETPSPSCWEKCYTEVDKYDHALYKVWKDEIDNLLIFAGLFSATVTSFAVESYRWLDGSDDVTSDLLIKLVAIQLNSTTILPVDAEPTGPTASAVRINIYWFLSLFLSLTTVFFGVLCLQWLREFQRPTFSSTFRDELRYRQLRFEGLRTWKVPEIISFLPLLLQISLLLFFTGIVELLWARHLTVALIVLVPMSCAALFLMTTTFFPIFQAIRIRLNCGQVADTVQCPYKSPLSWIVYRTFLPLLDLGWYAKDSWESWKACRASRSSSGSQEIWPGFDRLWVEYEFLDSTFSMLSRSVVWMLSEFRYIPATIFPMYQCLTIMDSQTAVAMISSLQVELQKLFGTSHTCPTWVDDDISREVACALLLQKSSKPYVARLEHAIRLSYEDPGFLPLISSDWISSVPKDRYQTCTEQVLMCTLSVMRNSQYSSLTIPILGHIAWLVLLTESSTMDHDAGVVIPYLLSMNLLYLKRQVLDGPYDLQEKYRAQVINESLCLSHGAAFPLQVQPYLADLAWTTIKRDGRQAVEIFDTDGAGDWLKFLRMKSWDAIESTREEDSELWWKKELSAANRPRDMSISSDTTHHVSTRSLSIKSSASHVI
ncbi:hypothetical protein BDN72DRAFT_848055 [Pluteus cervinus]|uniref:Uncharacterized protein n=1 Tax=Pluteus cervinus TaxID=181527 RepID=A0ACD3ABM9_9AGAR|nr:hypothetical protein BDN72DRAFT_848055 [Pluteus cervinus]